MNKPLHELAVPFDAFDGAVTFYMLPFINLEYEIYADELQRLHPREKWVHTQTKEEVFTDPHDNPSDDPIIEAQRKASKWERIDLWSPAYTYFLACVPLTVDIEFKGKKLPAAAKGIQAYWQGRNGSIGHNWELYRQVIGVQAANAWLEAHNHAQDDRMDAPQAIQGDPADDTDPN